MAKTESKVMKEGEGDNFSKEKSTNPGISD